MKTKKKWLPVTEEKVIKTQHWKYILGIYNHAQYGQRCFRISKYIRENDYFIGHFVVVRSDQKEVLPAIAQLIQSLIDEVNDPSGVSLQQEQAQNSLIVQLPLDNMFSNQTNKQAQ